MLRLQARLPAIRTQLWRSIASSRATMGGQTSMADMVSHGAPTVAVDHLMSVQRAAQVMTEQHVDAVPVTKNAKVVGLFTERDYFDKVLSGTHSAKNSSLVADVATMGPELVVAYPEDTVEVCLEVMTKKHLSAIPVVHHDGHLMGTVSVMDLTKELFDEHKPNDRTLNMAASWLAESSPDKHRGERLYDDFSASEQSADDKFDDLVRKLHAQAGTKHAEVFEGYTMDGNAYSEPSMFPEFTPKEDLLFGRSMGGMSAVKQELTAATAHHPMQDNMSALSTDELLTGAGFSQPSVFPDFSRNEDMMARHPELLHLEAEPHQEMEQPQMELHELSVDELASQSFSEPSVFPDFTRTEDVLARQPMPEPAKLKQPMDVMHEMPEAALEQLAHGSFSEPSVFPDFSPTEDVLLCEETVDPFVKRAIQHPHHAHVEYVPDEFVMESEFHKQAAAMDEMDIDPFCEPSDFPERSQMDEVLQRQRFTKT